MHLVWKIRLELDRTGGLHDLVIDETERALIQLNPIILAVGDNLERPFGILLLLLNLRQNRLREREYQRNRLELRDDHNATRVCRRDDVAQIDLTDASDAIDRRRQTRVAELHVRLLDERLVRFDGALQLRHLSLLRLNQLRR